MNKIIYELNQAHSIALLPHISPDGDALGSCYALREMFPEKEMTVFLDTDFPAFLRRWNVPFTKFTKEPKEFDLAIAVDTAAEQRLGRRQAIFDCARATMNIDHHVSNTYFAQFNYVEEAAATGEIIFQLAKEMNRPLSLRACEYLYTAIISDTGGFRYENTTSRTHSIASSLIEHGVRASEISTYIFEVVPLVRLKLQALAIEKMMFFFDNRVCVMPISTSMMKSVDAKEDDIEGLSVIPRSVQGVVIGVLVREMANKIKFSFRSHGDTNVSAIAEAFGGGGHKNAAGAYIPDVTIPQAIEALTVEIERMKIFD